MPLRLIRRAGIWHLSGTVAGRRIRRTTGTADKGIAERIKAETEADMWARRLDGDAAHMTFAHAALAYRDTGRPERFLAAVENHFTTTPLRKITAEAIRQGARKVYPGLSAATQNRQFIVPAAAIVNHAAALGWCAPIRVRRFPVETKTKAPASAEWVKAFAAQAEADGLPHLAALALFMFATGARIGEATALTWADLDLAARLATIRQTKVNDTRRAHLPAPVLAAVANIPGPRDPGRAVFRYSGPGGVKFVWANVIARAGIDYLSPHSCRHGFATTMMRAGFDVKTVAALGGWKDAATVLRSYAHALSDPTLSDAVFGKKLTQDRKSGKVNIRKQRGKRA
jgi:integrase